MYVLVSSEHAENLSRSLMRLLMPSHLRKSDWTDLYCGILTHPETGQTVLDLPDEDYVPIHLQATGHELSELLSVFVNDGALTQEEATGIIQSVRDNVGKKVRINDFIPPSWSEYVYTKQDLIDNGWMEAPSEPEVVPPVDDNLVINVDPLPIDTNIEGNVSI